MHGDCHVEPLEKTVNPEEAGEASLAMLAVWGMGCQNCANRVRNSLLGINGIVSAAIDLERGLAFVDYVPARVNLRDLIVAVAAAGNDGKHNYRAIIIS